MVEISELKSRYKLLVADRQTIESRDLSSDIPISTGSPVVDSFFLEKIKPTFSMPDYEHLARSWQLIRKMSEDEKKIILNNLDGCLNDHKILLAAKLFNEGEEDTAMLILDSMPFSWKLLFPLVFIKPSLVFFDGWKKDLRFRLFDSFSFDKLRQFYSTVLAEAGDVSILKFRERIHVTTALLGYKFETNKEKSIEDWCFGNGSNVSGLSLVELYVKARSELKKRDFNSFLNVLSSSNQKLPVTSIMGLLSSIDLVVYTAEREQLQDYIVDCASPIECILRLREWSPWLRKEHYDIISKKVKNAVLSSDVPFSKVTQAYLSVPVWTREEMTDSIFIPLLKKFGERVKFLLPEKFSFFQPANFIRLDNFLMFNIFNVSSKGEMHLVGMEKDFNYSFTVDDVKHVINMSDSEMQQFLLKEFGGLSSIYNYQYSNKRIMNSLSKLDSEDLLIFNTPFFQSLDVVDKLRSWKKVINLCSYFGAPTEISLSYSYENIIKLGKSLRAFKISTGPSAYNAITYLEKLHWFEKAAKEVEFEWQTK